MKQLLLFILMATCHSSFAQQRDYKDPVADIKDYRFELDLNDDNDTIKCHAVIRLVAAKDGNSLLIDLASVKNDGRGMRVAAVKENNQPIAYTHANNLLRITLPLKAGKEKTIVIDYKGVPADGLIISKNKYGQRTFFSDNWPNRGHNWLACIDHPSDKAAVDFIVTAPVHYQVVSNGLLVEETNLPNERKLTHWRETRELPVKAMAIGVAAFAVKYEGAIANTPADGNAQDEAAPADEKKDATAKASEEMNIHSSFPVSLYSWVYPQDREKGFYDYGMARDILPYFIQRIGPFPYQKLANVQSRTIFGGMENAGAIFYDEAGVAGDRRMEKLMAHEIAHQWFGNSATEADWSQLWLSEGLAVYLSLLYLEDKYGTDTLKKELAKSRREAIGYSKKKTAPIIDTTTDYLKLLNPNTYQKAGWVLHMLRTQLGEANFWKGIRKYYSAFAGKNAVTDDFRKIMESVSGKDLKQFFSQWLEKPGHPILQVDWKYDEQKKQALVTVIQKQAVEGAREGLFQFPLVIQFENEEGVMYKSALVKERQTVFAAPMETPPLKVNIDPNMALLYE